MHKDIALFLAPKSTTEGVHTLAGNRLVMSWGFWIASVVCVTLMPSGPALAMMAGLLAVFVAPLLIRARQRAGDKKSTEDRQLPQPSLSCRIACHGTQAELLTFCGVEDVPFEPIVATRFVMSNRVPRHAGRVAHILWRRGR